MSDTVSPEVWRGKKRQTKTRDPQARHRWPVERTNAWLKARRRIATRRDRKADNYLAFLHLAMLHILATSFRDKLQTPFLRHHFSQGEPP